VSANLWFNSCW